MAPRGRSWVRRASAAVAGVLMVVMVAPTVGSATEEPARAGGAATVPAKVGCASLPGVDFTRIPGASTKVTSAAETTAPEGYRYCLVKGTIAPKIQVEIHLPTKTWTGRYMQTGCGGFCGGLGVGVIAGDGCAPVAGGEFVTASNDSGHVSTNPSGKWAEDKSARVDFAYRSEHVLSVVAKRVIQTFYGQPPRFSYFNSCSNGGRQALMEAQRFPRDFNGIIAGAPANLFAPLAAQFLGYTAMANRDAAGKQILGPEKLAPLHNAVVAACDKLDGLADKQIDDPRRCKFDPASQACPTGVDRADCLTSAQVITVRKFYTGPRDPKSGVPLYPGAAEPGSELSWYGWQLGMPEVPTGLAYDFGENYLKYLAYKKSLPASFTLKDAKFDARSYASLAEMARLYNASDPDLSAFRNAGGKLILWHGWSDSAIPPRGTLAYRQAMEDRMGGFDAVQRFSRMFMLPQVAHCAGGDAPDAIDLVSPMTAWVERGKAPTVITATQRQGSTVVRTRPIHAYPTQARYNGTGDINKASSFHPVTPTKRPDDHVRWIGTFR